MRKAHSQLRDTDRDGRYSPTRVDEYVSTSKPIFNSDEKTKSPIHQTIDEKTVEYMARKRAILDKHTLQRQANVPLQARLQTWEVNI